MLLEIRICTSRYENSQNKYDPSFLDRIWDGRVTTFYYIYVKFHDI